MFISSTLCSKYFSERSFKLLAWVFSYKGTDHISRQYKTNWPNNPRPHTCQLGNGQYTTKSSLNYFFFRNTPKNIVLVKFNYKLWRKKTRNSRNSVPENRNKNLPNQFWIDFNGDIHSQRTPHSRQWIPNVGVDRPSGVKITNTRWRPDMPSC